MGGGAAGGLSVKLVAILATILDFARIRNQAKTARNGTILCLK